MELSKRLQAVADLLYHESSDCADSMDVVADVGTDHGYIPIYLVESGRCKKAFAMDVNKGPLLRAQEHVAEHGLQGRIETRLSDGVKALVVGECDSVIVAGMGGALTVKILSEGEMIFRSLKQFVLQPQSEIFKVRRYLYEHGYHIVTEDMVLEDGKFYPMMRVENGADHSYSEDESKRTIEFSYGKCLLVARHPVLKRFLEKELRTKTEIFTHLSKNFEEQSEVSQPLVLRRRELATEIAQIEQALEMRNNYVL